jgi:hypothetical protein
LALDPSNAELRQKLEMTIRSCKKDESIVPEGFKCGAPEPAAPAAAAPGAEAREAMSKLSQGKFHLARGEYDEAIASFQEGVNLDPSNAELRRELKGSIEACRKEEALLREGLRCGARTPIVTLIPSGPFLRWNAPVTNGMTVPDNSIEGGLKPIGSLTVPPVAGSPPNAFVLFIIDIDPDGNVTPERKVSDDYGLGPQVMAAAKGWKFNIPMVKGQPVSTIIAVRVSF